MAADILRFFPENDPSKITGSDTGMNTANELLLALGELAVEQERGGTSERLAHLGRTVDAAVRRMNEASDINSAA